MSSSDADAPKAECVDTAIDFAYYHMKHEASPPSSVAWSGGGGLVLEWKAGAEVEAIEVLAGGMVEVTTFRSGRVVGSRRLAIQRPHQSD